MAVADARGAVGSTRHLQGWHEVLQLWSTMLPIGVARCVGPSGKFTEGASLRSPSWISSWLLPFYSGLIMNITYIGFLAVWAGTFGGRCRGVSISRVCG